MHDICSSCLLLANIEFQNHHLSCILNDFVPKNWYLVTGIFIWNISLVDSFKHRKSEDLSIFAFNLKKITGAIPVLEQATCLYCKKMYLFQYLVYHYFGWTTSWFLIEENAEKYDCGRETGFSLYLFLATSLSIWTGDCCQLLGLLTIGFKQQIRTFPWVGRIGKREEVSY